METMQEGHWNNARLDDLNGRVSDLGRRMDAGFARADRRMDEGFARVDADLRGLRGEMGGLRGEMNSRFEHVDARFEHIDQRFDALQRTMLQLGGGVIVALIGLIATQL
jgi:hypothetical protein